MDRPNDVGIPAFEATDGQGPQGPKVEHLVSRGIRIGQHAREALIAGPEFVNGIARDRASPRGGLTGPGTRQHQNVKRALAREGRHLVRHGADIEFVEIVGAADHVIVAEFHENLW